MRPPLPECSIALPALYLACLMGLPCGADAAMQPCGSPATALADLRSPGQISPLAGRTAEVQAIVTADFSGDGGLRGFFLQTADAQRVHRPGLSEGLFVYAPRARADVGDMVRVSGRIEEKFGQTQLVLSGSPLVCARGLSVKPQTLTLPLAGESDLAALEGMLVRLPQTLTVSDAHELGRYGTLVLSHGRPIAPTQQALPGPAARQAAADNARNRLLLAGDTIAGVQGVLERRHGQWRLQPVRGAAAPAYQHASPRPSAPRRHPATALRVAAFNLQNYFNGDGLGGGLDAPDNRGAQDAAALARQQAKLVAALSALDADVIGLMEVQNNGFGPTGAIRQLAALLGPDWRVVDPGTPALGADAIAVGLLYNARTALPAGRVATTWLGERSRQPLAATFRTAAGGAPVTVVVNHFKSKNCVEAAGTQADQRDGQGCWNPARVQAADTLARWLGTAPTGIADTGVLVIGDLNSYAMEDPIRLLARRGYADLVARFAGPHAYSYVYAAQAGYLDHVLADATAMAHVIAVHAWHINADEPAALSYAAAPGSGAAPGFYAPDAYRSSDHDPLVVDFASSPRAR
ncbi:MAG: ExeM/NucH family extracellular endonuclease [Cupriavidus sp.]|nr:ExeM/NucH family extracellular endonuclease [Cupriavidus sp.]